MDGAFQHDTWRVDGFHQQQHHFNLTTRHFPRNEGEYSDIRKVKLRESNFPASIIAMSVISKSENPKQESLDRAIPEFKRFNIIESEVWNVN